MITATHTKTTAVLLAGSLLLLGGCDNREEPAPPPEEQSQAPAARDMEPTPPAAQEQQAPDIESPQTPMQEQTSPQTGEGAAAPGAAAGGGDVETALRNAACFACHEVEQKKIGPAYAWVAHRYQDDANAVETLANTIKNGSSGKWTSLTGGIPMPPNLQLSDEQAREMAQWILEREPQEPPGG